MWNTLFALMFCTALSASAMTIVSRDSLLDANTLQVDDMILTQEQLDAFFNPKPMIGRSRIDERYHWPSATIPYSIPEFEFTQKQINTIEKALAFISKMTCFKFVPHTTELDYVELLSTSSGCHSFFGRQGGKQILNLSPKCVRTHTIQHEFMHAMGFPHMQSVSNRDNYVKINFENILEGREYNFLKMQKNKYSMLGLPYDYESVLHYEPKAFSKNNLPTIESLNSSVILKKNIKISTLDLERINRMYCK